MAELTESAEIDAETQDANATMQAMMGFSSFGGPAKKRKTQGQIDNTSDGMRDSSPRATGSQAHLNLLPASLPPRPPTNSLPAEAERSNDSLLQDPASTDGPAQQPPQSVATVPEDSSDSVYNPNPVYSANDVRSDPAYWNTAGIPTHTTAQTSRGARGGAHSQSYGDEIAYTNPDSGISLTRRELDEYSKGKSEVDKDGNPVTVYFRPSFISDNLWDRWEGKNTAAQGREETHVLEGPHHGGDGEQVDEQHVASWT